MSILVLTSDTLIGTPAAGNVEYNGQFYGTDSNNARAQLQRITQGTSVASTSGTSIDFTALPAWVKRITVMLNGVSTSGISDLVCQIGSGSIVTTGYVSSYSAFNNAPTASSTTASFGLFNNVTAATTRNCVITITNITGNVWIQSSVGSSSAPQVSSGSGSLTLAGALDRVRITTANGTDTFDAGSINIMYEG